MSTVTPVAKEGFPPSVKACTIVAVNCAGVVPTMDVLIAAASASEVVASAPVPAGTVIVYATLSVPPVKRRPPKSSRRVQVRTLATFAKVTPFLLMLTIPAFTPA